MKADCRRLSYFVTLIRRIYRHRIERTVTRTATRYTASIEPLVSHGHCTITPTHITILYLHHIRMPEYRHWPLAQPILPTPVRHIHYAPSGIDTHITRDTCHAITLSRPPRQRNIWAVTSGWLPHTTLRRRRHCIGYRVIAGPNSHATTRRRLNTINGFEYRHVVCRTLRIPPPRRVTATLYHLVRICA